MRPGVEITSATSAPPQGVPTDTSVAFLVGEARMGPLDRPTRISSLDDFVATYGDRLPGVPSYDWLDAAFHEGVSTAWFMRLGEGTAVAEADATVIVAENTATAGSAGAWGNSLTLDVVPTPGGQVTEKRKRNGNGNGSGARTRSPLLTYSEEDARPTGPTFIAYVSVAGKAVQTSQPLVTQGELAAFLAQNSYLQLQGADPAALIAAGSVALTGGADGTVPVADPDALPDALALIPREAGPGNLSAAGHTTAADHAALLAHASINNRVAILDGAIGDDALALESAAAYLRGAEEDRYGSLWGPWATIPGLAPGTSRTVPWSAIQCGLLARNDLAGNPNQASAGSWGQSVYATGLAQTFTPLECQTLLYAGVDTARTVYGSIQAYAFRTLVDPSGPRSGWRELNHARLNMAITAQGEAIGQQHIFAQLDGRGHELAAFNGQLAGMLKEYYDIDALYGDDVTEAYEVNTSSAVNTPESLADGVIMAVLEVRMSPHAELVKIAIIKYPITIALA